MSEQLLLDRIENNLLRLRLPRIGEILAEMLKTFENQSRSYLSFLDALLEEEVATKEQSRVENTLRISGLPFIKSLDEFDFRLIRLTTTAPICSMQESWKAIPRLYLSLRSALPTKKPAGNIFTKYDGKKDSPVRTVIVEDIG